MCIKFEGMHKSLEIALENINIAFTGIFIIEAIIKITAIGKQYFVDYWNLFDLIIIILSCATILLDGF
jgi:hypothetical protein